MIAKGATLTPATELARGNADPAPLWMVLDCTPEGRGTDRYPKLDYES